MGQIIETLPKEGKETLKSTYDNIIDLGISKGIEQGISKGIKQGISIGKQRGVELERLNLTLNAVKSDLETVFIVNFLEVSEKLVKLIKVNVAEKFQSKELAIILATELMERFKNLDAKDIATFCHLQEDDVAKLKEKLS